MGSRADKWLQEHEDKARQPGKAAASAIPLAYFSHPPLRFKPAHL
jgi:hypothetical protein